MTGKPRMVYLDSEEVELIRLAPELAQPFMYKQPDGRVLAEADQLQEWRKADCPPISDAEAK